MKHILRLVCFVLALCSPVMVLAHAQLNGSEPAPNALVPERPQEVVLWFSEPISPVAMRWISPAGDSFEASAEGDGKQARVTPPPEAGNGSYLLAWRVVSLDGHPVSGILVISVGETSDVPSLSNIELPPIATWSVIAMKFALTLCLILGVGGVVYQSFVAKEISTARGKTRSLTMAGLYLAFPVALLLVVTQGLDLLGLPLSGIFSGAPWATGAGTSILRTALLSATAAGLALAVVRVPTLSQNASARAGLVLGAWALAALSYAVSGHTATAEPEWRAFGAIFIHGLAMLFWLGALVPLLSLIGRGAEGLDELRRFSAMAIPFVLVLLVTGFVLASIHAGAGGFQAIGMSGYGILLFIKLVSVIGLLLLAVHNRLVLTPAFNAGTPGADKALSGSIRVELILAMMIILFASSFRLTPPPTIQSQTPDAQIVALSEKDITAELRLTPGQVGPNTIELSLTNADGTALQPVEVTFGFSLPENALGPILVTASQQDTEAWRAESFILPQPGTWQVSIDVLVTDFEIVTLSTSLEVAP